MTSLPVSVVRRSPSNKTKTRREGRKKNRWSNSIYERKRHNDREGEITTTTTITTEAQEQQLYKPRRTVFFLSLS